LFSDKLNQSRCHVSHPVMSEQMLCRQCQRVSSGRRAFKIPGAEPRYAPDLPVRLEHILLDVKVDPRTKLFEGVVTQRIRIVAPNQKCLKLDQIGLQILAATISGKPAHFSIDGQALFVDFPEELRSLTPGDKVELSIRYKAPSLRRGFYFTGPDQDYPNKRYQAWSQGQDEDTRYWIPTFDYPNQKATTEIIASVPKGFTAVSNGALLEHKDLGEFTRFHYKLGTPHVTYLISLVVAEFTEITDAGPDGLPVQYFVSPGCEEDGKRAFGNTPKMIAAYAKRIGVSYPYEKYSQVAVQDFIFGGMENTSSTTQTDRALHDARAHLDLSSDPLVSHELAHQWFGDLLTCRDWSHGWLNEGFATFMERVWVESNIAEYGSEEMAREEGKYYSYIDLKEHQSEDSEKYRRPIVCNTYIEPIDLFDTHLYQKGGLVLNLVRATLGEELFWRSINLYVTRHRGQSVETFDLIRAIEDATGQNMRRFFDEWIFSGGYPEFELSYQWHDDKKLVELVIEQKQTGGKPSLEKDDVVTPLFHLPVLVELSFEGGKKASYRIDIGEPRDRVFLPAESKPLMVRFDPGNTIPKTLKFPRPKEMLLFQLENDPDCMGRIEAAKELVKIADLDVIAAFKKRVLEDRFWGVQSECAAVLAEVRSHAARDALIAGLAVKNPKARRAVVKALARYKDAESAQALKPYARSDESYFVEADATYSWASVHARPALLNAEVDEAARAEIEQAEKFLVQQLEKSSHLEVIRGAALRGLGELPGVSRGERQSTLAVLMEWTRRGKSEEARLAAISALGHVAQSAVTSERARILRLMDQLADEDNFRVRMKLVQALSESQASDAIPVLQKIRRLDLDGRVKRDALMVVDVLQTAGSTPEVVTNLKTALEKMEEEHRKLKSMFEEYRAGVQGK
jgi:aminopeptidase N